MAVKDVLDQKVLLYRRSAAVWWTKAANGISPAFLDFQPRQCANHRLHFIPSPKKKRSWHRMISTRTAKEPCFSVPVQPSTTRSLGPQLNHILAVRFQTVAK